MSGETNQLLRTNNKRTQAQDSSSESGSDRLRAPTKKRHQGQKRFTDAQNLLETSLCINLNSVRDVIQRRRIRLSVGKYMYGLLGKMTDANLSSSESSAVADDSEENSLKKTFSLQEEEITKFANYMSTELGCVDDIDSQNTIQRKVVIHMNTLIDKLKQPTQDEANNRSVRYWLQKVDSDSK